MLFMKVLVPLLLIVLSLSLKLSFNNIYNKRINHYINCNNNNVENDYNNNDNKEIYNDNKQQVERNNDNSVTGLRQSDLQQDRDLDLILTERAQRFYDPKLVGIEKEKCIIVAVTLKKSRRGHTTLSSTSTSTSIKANIDDDDYDNNNIDIDIIDDIDNNFDIIYDNDNIDNNNNDNNKYDLMALKSTSTKMPLAINDNDDNDMNLNSKKDDDNDVTFTFQESLSELSELVGTAGLEVKGIMVQKLQNINSRTYVGSGKIVEIMELVNRTSAKTIVIDDDLTSKQQRNLEDAFASYGGADVKILDRTAIILEIFAQHASSREGQLQVELAMLEYRLTRGPKASGSADTDSGCGFRGPGETKVETDKRLIRDKIVLLKREIDLLGIQREQHRKSRQRLGLPVIALVGYTNAGKSSLLNKLSRAGVLAENMLFATLDPTTRKINLPTKKSKNNDIIEADNIGIRTKGQEVLLTDTVGFISKLPTDLIAAFRATLEEVGKADVLIHVCDRSSPVWKKQRETVLQELDAIGCTGIPIVELWNKVDLCEDSESIMLEAACVPVDTYAEIIENKDNDMKGDNFDEISFESTASSVNEFFGSDLIESSSTSTFTKNKKYEEDTYHWSGNDDEYISDTSNSTRSDKENENQYSSPNILKSKFRKIYPRQKRKTYYVAASVKTGLGFDDFIVTLEDALSLLLKKINVFIPYSKDSGIITKIHNQGIVDITEYRDMGTYISCRVPDALFNKLEEFKV